MPERVAGSELLSLLQREQLQHGKFSIFHRMHETQAVFSVASMVEPGTFDPAAMATQQFPGVTLFMQLPGPLDGLIAYDQMISCAQRVAHATGGSLQDERGSKLTQQTMERLREEVLDFQHLIGGVTAL
jgi:cell division protein ZipA